ncbi:HD domain-containing protein [Micromonospora zamorensis]|uniref:HD domain-containing protein n=1 Tax=Micromonospora zamorensis TaxID=709883 RepID=UPI002ED3B5F2|nr:HD domain-containing protein [Micromonospora zamorensis]
MDDLLMQAAELAERHLAGGLPRRWKHVQAVALKADRIAHVLDDADAQALVASAWLHDLGYAPSVADTGLHALDGARWLLANGWPRRIAALVAHHSCAQFEADERGLGNVLAEEFDQERSSTADALWFADMTTGPDGQDLDVLERLAEIHQRYGPDSVVVRFWARATPTLLEAVERTEATLAAQPM